VKHPPRYQIWWQVDTGVVRREQRAVTNQAAAGP